MPHTAFRLHTGILVKQRPVFIIFTHPPYFMRRFIRQAWPFIEIPLRHNPTAHMAPHAGIFAVRAGDHGEDDVFGIRCVIVTTHRRRDVCFHTNAVWLT